MFLARLFQLFKGISVLLGLLVSISIISCTSNSQNMAFEKFMVYPASDESFMGFSFGDINQDGFIDLVSEEGGFGGPLLWHESMAGGSEWIEHSIAETGPNGIHFCTGDLELGDFDNDGDLDVPGFEHPGEWTDNYTADTIRTSIYWYENSGVAQSWEPHFIGYAPDFVKDVEVVDLNSNERIDVVTITYRDEQTISVFRQDANGSWTRVHNFPIQGLHEGMDSGDVDGDGDVDIVTNGYWLENPGGDLTDKWIMRSIHEKWHNQSGNWRQNATKIYCQDITNDGRVEVFISHSERSGFPLALYNTDDPSIENNWTEIIIDSGLTAVHTLEVGDINGDGRFDILAGENGDHSAPGDDDMKQVRIYLNQGNEMTWKKIEFSDEGLYNGRLIDLDNDGFLDIGGPHGHRNANYYVWINQLE